MSATLPIPAAQYLRMSTEDQQYSIANQQARIREYAENHGFNIIKTYEDPGEAKFKVVLVYDVSRWGRFQNPDEAAHYEFLCARSVTTSFNNVLSPFRCLMIMPLLPDTPSRGL